MIVSFVLIYLLVGMFVACFADAYMVGEELNPYLFCLIVLVWPYAGYVWVVDWWRQKVLNVPLI